MQEYNINYLMYRVIDGYIEYNDRRIYDPKGKILSLGSKIFHKYRRKNFDLLSNEEIYIFLCECADWNSEKEKKIKSLPSQIEDLKIQYFEKYIGQRKMVRKNLESKIKEYDELLVEKNQFFQYTCEGIANGAMWQAMISRMYKGEDKLAALNYYRNNLPSEEDIRDIALSSNWSSYFMCSKNPFGRSAINLTTLQRQLLQWSRVYKNVQSNPECPNERIMHDHWAFDGWLIQQNRKSRAEKKNKISHKKEADNYYISVSSEEEAKEVYELNDEQSKNKMRSMMKEIEKHGSIKEQHFSHYRNRK